MQGSEPRPVAAIGGLIIRILAGIMAYTLANGTINVGSYSSRVRVVFGTTRRASVVVRRCRSQRYVGRISGPLLDRIDIHIDVPAVKFRELTGDDSSDTDSSTAIRNRVIQARQRQLRRFKGDKIFSNAAMTPRMIRTPCQIDSTCARMLESAMTRLGLSTRAYDRILKVSRIIAHLERLRILCSPTMFKAKSQATVFN